jgi:hypothetical protein
MVQMLPGVLAEMGREQDFEVAVNGRVNCSPITPGWNYAIRMYEPRTETLDGSWRFPVLQRSTDIVHIGAAKRNPFTPSWQGL